MSRNYAIIDILRQLRKQVNLPTLYRDVACSILGKSTGTEYRKCPIITREDNYNEAPSAGAMRGRGMRTEGNQLKRRQRKYKRSTEHRIINQNTHNLPQRPYHNAHSRYWWENPLKLRLLGPRSGTESLHSSGA